MLYRFRVDGVLGDVISQDEFQQIAYDNPEKFCELVPDVETTQSEVLQSFDNPPRTLLDLAVEENQQLRERISKLEHQPTFLSGELTS